MGTTVLTSTTFVTDIAINRKPKFMNRVQENVSGKETRVALRVIPRWTWDITFNAVRSTAQSQQDFANLTSFYNSLSGGFDSFLWLDPEDNFAVNSQINFVSAGLYQMTRTLGTFEENIFAPSTLNSVTIQGSSGSTAGASISLWGTATPGILTLASTAGVSTTTNVYASFSYYWPVRWDQDEMQFDRFGYGWWEVKKMSFTSII